MVGTVHAFKPPPVWRTVPLLAGRVPACRARAAAAAAGSAPPWRTRRVKARREIRSHVKHNQRTAVREVSTLEIAKLTIMSAPSKVIGQFVEDLLEKHEPQTRSPKPIM